MAIAEFALFMFLQTTPDKFRFVEGFGPFQSVHTCYAAAAVEVDYRGSRFYAAACAPLAPGSSQDIMTTPLLLPELVRRMKRWPLHRPQ